MRLLLDENLSPNLVAYLADDFPGSVHVRDVGLVSASDAAVWEFAKAHGYAILSKDADFRQRSILFGPSPKVIGLLVGNCSTSRARELLRTSTPLIRAFLAEPAAAFLELP